MTKVQLDIVTQPENQPLKMHAFVHQAPVKEGPPPLMSCFIDARNPSEPPLVPIWHDGSVCELAPGKYALFFHAEQGGGKCKVSIVEAGTGRILISKEYDLSAIAENMLPFIIEA